MAEYVRLRLTAAKVSVTMTFLALLAGITERARANPLVTRPGTSANFLQDAAFGGSGGGSKLVLKLDSALSTLEHKLSTSYYTRHKLNQTFLKIKSANTEFLKIRSANTNFLKIDDANANFLKLDTANGEFLKIDTANNEFLKLDGTAANAGELGGQAPDAFFQGHGNVVTGALNLPHNSTSGQLVALPGGIIVVKGTANSDEAVLDLVNNTGTALPAVQNGTAMTLAPGDNQLAPLTNGSAHQLTIQILPGGSFQDVVTLIISADPAGNNATELVAQAFTGGV